MSTLQTLREPKAERPRSKPAVQDVVENDIEVALERFDRWLADCEERRRLTGNPDLDYEEEERQITAISVAIVKEVRAERYAEEQERKNAAGR